jgi:signal transduction histidine kinase
MTAEWARPRPGARSYRRDAIGALAVALGMGVSLMLYTRLNLYEDPAEPWASALIVALLCLPLALRRRFPEAVAVIASIAFFACQSLAVPEVLVSNIALFVAFYTLGAWGRNRRRSTILRVAIIAGMFVWLTVNLLITVSDPDLLPQVSRSGVFSQFATFALINIMTNILYFGGAFYFGNSSWAAARDRAELVSRTEELERERAFSSAQAVALDRMQIARELHDVVAHHVSVMGVQAGAARRVIATDPNQAAASLATIEHSSRAAVDELHRLLVTLRDSGRDAAIQPGSNRSDSNHSGSNHSGSNHSGSNQDGASRSAAHRPAASQGSSTLGIDQLPSLIAESESAGHPVDFSVIGTERPVTALAGFTAYRVAQEALTNVRKHAGERATVDMRLRYLDDAIELEVSDTGMGSTAIATAGSATAGMGTARFGAAGAGVTGMGLLGMRERILAVGGTLDASPRAQGGFRVRAAIPEHRVNT